MNNRSEALAARLEAGATALAAVGSAISDTEWQTPVPRDGRKIGVVVHYVASVYPIEIHLAQELAAGRPITAVTSDAVHTMNHGHSKENDGVTKEAALALLAANSATAAAAIRALGDAELDSAAPVSLNSDAPSPASSCWSIMRSATATTTSRGSERHSAGSFSRSFAQ